MLVAVAQVWPQMGPGMAYGRFYNPTTEITAHGVVVSQFSMLLIDAGGAACT